MGRCVLALLVAACGGSSTPPAGPPTHTGSAAPAADAAVAMDAATPAAITLADADCRAFAAAPALGIAVVVSSTPDCSGVGHARIVLEVKELARGDKIKTVVASRPLHGPDDGARLREGDTVVVAVAPAKEAARTVSCVPLPASDGTLRHAVTVEGADAGRRLLGVIVDGSACAGH